MQTNNYTNAETAGESVDVSAIIEAINQAPDSSLPGFQRMVEAATKYDRRKSKKRKRQRR